MRKKNGVVIAIVALLLSILTPALNQIKDRARRIMCRNRLHQWGIANNDLSSINNNNVVDHGFGFIPKPFFYIKSDNLLLTKV
jgi:hypothetical protein